MVHSDGLRKSYMKRAAALGRYAVENGLGGPFGAVVVKEGAIIGEGYNSVTSSGDPTAHAEIVAIRNACLHLGSFQLTGCEIYCTCEPCPMCLGAIYWARPSALWFGTTRHNAAAAGFDDSFIYDELALPLPDRKIPSYYLPDNEAVEIFSLWNNKVDRTIY